MTSGKQARKQRQAAVARPPVRSTGGRRASPKVLGIALALIVVVALAVVLAIVFTGGGSGNSSVQGSTLPDAATIEAQLGGIPQQGNVLGQANAPVTMVEYIDLQCPVCRQFETEVMPSIIQRYVRPGKVKVEVRPIAFIGPDSERGRNAMVAAEPHGKAFNFSQILYFNQGTENTGWLDDSMIASAATSVGLDPQTILDNMDSQAVKDRTAVYDQQSRTDAVSGTPTIGIGKTGAKPAYFPAGDPGLSAVTAALDKAIANAS
jgi:protein-disulfide isomerase